MSRILEEEDMTPIPAGPEHQEDPDYKSPNRLAAWFCRVSGIFHAVIAAVESTDMERRLGSSELGLELYSMKTDHQLARLEKRFKAFRAEQSNCQLLIAKQRDEIGALRGQVNAHREIIRERTASKPAECPPIFCCEICGSLLQRIEIMSSRGFETFFKTKDGDDRRHEHPTTFQRLNV